MEGVLGPSPLAYLLRLCPFSRTLVVQEDGLTLSCRDFSNGGPAFFASGLEASHDAGCGPRPRNLATYAEGLGVAAVQVKVDFAPEISPLLATVTRTQRFGYAEKLCIAGGQRCFGAVRDASRASPEVIFQTLFLEFPFLAISCLCSLSLSPIVCRLEYSLHYQIVRGCFDCVQVAGQCMRCRACQTVSP